MNCYPKWSSLGILWSCSRVRKEGSKRVMEGLGPKLDGCKQCTASSWWRELSIKAKLSIYWSSYVPSLTYDHKLWLVTERMRVWIQAAEISFILRVAGLFFRDRVRSSVIWEGLRVELQLLYIQRCQWDGSDIWLDAFWSPTVWGVLDMSRQWPRPRTQWQDYIS